MPGSLGQKGASTALAYQFINFSQEIFRQNDMGT